MPILFTKVIRVVFGALKKNIKVHYFNQPQFAYGKNFGLYPGTASTVFMDPDLQWQPYFFKIN
jgi:hypothetical protein